MYVILLLIDGQLKNSANRKNPNDAMVLAQEWAGKYRDKGSNGYIAIEEQIRGKEVNRHFAKVTFDVEPDNVKFYLREKGENPLISSNVSPIFKSFVFTLVEFILVELKEYLKDHRNGSGTRRDGRY